MREIKFRGKTAYGNWVIGSLIINNFENYFIESYNKTGIRNTVLVIPETVGQFTGLLDRKGKEIYEGDIINWLSIRHDRVGFVEQGHIEWRQIEGCYVVVNRFDTTDHRELIYQLIRCTKNITIVGNIHDNPELLKVE